MDYILTQAITQQNQTSSILQLSQIPQVEKAAGTYSSYLPLLDTVGIAVTVILIASTLYFMIKTGWLPLRIDRVRDVILKSNLPKKYTVRGWKNVRHHYYRGTDADLKLAVIEADKLLDEALKAAGLKGNNLGERLKGADETDLPNLRDVWEAHKLRNRLVHEPNFEINREVAEKALAIYRKTLRNLGILD